MVVVVVVVDFFLYLDKENILVKYLKISMKSKSYQVFSLHCVTFTQRKTELFPLHPPTPES